MRPFLQAVLFGAIVVLLAYALPISPFEGRWTWDAGRSVRAPNDSRAAPAAKSLLTLSANDRRYAEVLEILDAEGVRHHSAFDAAVNDGPASVTGGQEGTRVTVRHDDPFSFIFDIDAPNGEHSTETCSVLPRGRTQVCRGTFTDAAGRSGEYVDTYTRD